MKRFLVILGAVALVSGCATDKQGGGMHGTETYGASYEPVWRAAVDAAQVGGLQVTTADKQAGYIGARRGVQPSSYGSNVGLWVRPVSPTQTRVEIVSHQAGEPAAWVENWEHDVFASLRANLSRQAGHSIVYEPAGAVPLDVPEQALPPVAPPSY